MVPAQVAQFGCAFLHVCACVCTCVRVGFCFEIETRSTRKRNKGLCDGALTSVYIERMATADPRLAWAEHHADAGWGTTLLQRHQLVFESDATDAKAFLVVV